MSSLLLILLSAVLVSMVAIRGVEGWRPFVDTTDVYENAVGVALAHAIALPLVGLASGALASFVLDPLQLGYLRTPAFIALVIVVASLTEVWMRRQGKHVPARPAFALLLTTNSALFGVALAGEQLSSRFVGLVFVSFGAAAGFAILLLSAATLYERIRYADVPAPFKEAPIALITAGLMALGCMGFIGLIPE
jgi:electron transport complex protein RnfA